MAEGLKYDGGKLRWDLLPMAEVEEIVKVLTMGANKYADNNWQLVEGGNERYYAALMRHLVEWRKGSKIDPESNLNHLSHVLCNTIFLLWLDHRKDMDETETEN